MGRFRHLYLAALVGSALLVSMVDASACPTCRDALADSPQGQSVATGFYYSILFMMSMPFVVLSALGMVAYRSVQSAKAAQDCEA